MIFLVPDYFDGEAAPGVFGGFAFLVYFVAASKICGDAGVERAIRT